MESQEYRPKCFVYSQLRMRSSKPFFVVAAEALAVLAILAIPGGCGNERQSSSVAGAGVGPTAADLTPAPSLANGKTPDPALAILNEMITAYRSCSTYADRGLIRLQYRVNGERTHDDGQFSVQFSRQNRLLVQAYQLTMVADGQHLHAIIADAATADLEGQVSRRPLAGGLSLATVYDDPLVAQVVSSGMGGPPVQLELLLSEKPLAHLLAEGVRRELLPEDSIQDRICDRVRVQLSDGPLVLWIDRSSRLLRRLEYPTAAMAATMAADGDSEHSITDVSLIAEFRDARFNAELPESEFRFEPPPQAKLVERFRLPPPPPPSDLLGQVPADFAFQSLDGDSIDSRSLLGKVSVLVWFNDHPACRATLEQFQQVQAKLAPDTAVNFVAVCTEPTEFSDDKLRDLAANWGLKLPLVRDLQAHGRDIFHIPWAPTWVALDAAGTVQVFEAGANPQLAEQFSQTLQRLLRGEDLAAEALARFRAERQAFETAIGAEPQR